MITPPPTEPTEPQPDPEPDPALEPDQEPSDPHDAPLEDDEDARYLDPVDPRRLAAEQRRGRPFSEDDDGS